MRKNKASIDETNWQDIWKSAANGQIPQDMAQDILQRLGERFQNDGTDRTKFGVSVQVSSAFKLGAQGDILKNESVISLVNAFRNAGREVRAFALLSKPQDEEVIYNAIKKEGWKLQINPVPFLNELEQRAKGDKRLMELVVASGTGWTPEESGIVQRSHVGVINTDMMWKWKL